MIKPTVGLMVWYWPRPDENIAGNDGAQPLAAIVAHVWNDTCVNLAVFNANGSMFDADGHVANRTSVFLFQGEGERPASGFAEWMSYQKGQADKTEALEEQLRPT